MLKFALNLKMRLLSTSCDIINFVFRLKYQPKMSDPWQLIQAVKTKHISLREKLQKRKKERQDILSGDPLGKRYLYAKFSH